LKKVKELAPELKTVYIMQVAWGDFYNMDYVDVYSIKYIYVTREMVRRIHKEGKEVYVWTVDDRKVIEQMMLKDVDNIITNRPKFVRETMASLYEEGTLYDIIQTYVTGQ
jgi:glycerophosphoryl diester phosphodiesterase